MCSQNDIYLEEKEKREKEMRNQIISEAEEYKRSFHKKRKANSETNKAHNREREKVYKWQKKHFLIHSCTFVPFCDVKTNIQKKNSSFTWPTKRSFTKKQTNSTGKQ